MGRMVDAAAARVRLGVATILGGAGGFLVLSLLATTTASAPSAVVLAAVAATVAAVVGLDRQLVTSVCCPLRFPLRSADAVPALLAARVTDTARHPLRPRAPGLV